MYLIVFVILLVIELLYFRVAQRLGIVDVPNSRSSHTSVMLRGGGVIFPLAIFLWAILLCMMGGSMIVMDYWPFLTGLLLLSVTGFIDDIHVLSATTRLIVQFLAVGMMLGQLVVESGWMTMDNWLLGGVLFVVAMIAFVGTVNIINFMDGVNGITAGYSLAVLMPLLILNNRYETPFIPNSFLWVTALGAVVFALFNFRPKGKAKCFAGDVGSLSIGFILLFAIGRLIVKTGDVTWLLLLAIYGVDGYLTIVHRVMLHDNIGKAHRKHAYQLMANELKMSHIWVSLIYMTMQLAVSLVAIYVIPDTIVAHWIYLVAVGLVLALAYVLFMMKYYHLHEEYLSSLRSSEM